MPKTILSTLFMFALSVGVSAATLKVTKISDTNDGVCNSDCSLREAISSASDGDTIVFDEIFFNVTRVIELTLGELSFNKNLNIIGTGANKLTVRRSSLTGAVFFRVFNISGVSGISNLTIAGGNLSDAGGGILNTGILTLTNVEIRENTAFIGGGIYNNGFLVVTNSTISNNTTSGGAAGIDNIGTMNIQNSTISNNQAGTNGGGIINISGTSTLRNVTIVFNMAASAGGGLIRDGGTVNLGNVLIADNTSSSGQDVFGLVNSEGYNFIENITGNVAGVTTGNIIGVDAQLDPNGLNTNNGFTRTVALQPTSPAIDKGNKFGINTDQRGRIRPRDNPNIPNAMGGDGSDIGAFELDALPFSNSFFGGRVLSPDLRGVSRAIVSLTSPTGEVRYAFTNHFGYFGFQNVPVGINYIFNVRHKRYTFLPQTIFVGSDSNDLNFTVR